MRRLFAITAILAGLMAASAIGAGAAMWAKPEEAWAARFTASTPWGWDADDDGNEIITATCGTGSGTQLTDADTNAQNPAARKYRLVAITDDVYLCDAATCSSPDGVLFPAGTVEAWRPDATGAYACRSASGSGVIRLHPVIDN